MNKNIIVVTILLFAWVWGVVIKILVPDWADYGLMFIDLCIMIMICWIVFEINKLYIVNTHIYETNKPKEPVPETRTIKALMEFIYNQLQAGKTADSIIEILREERFADYIIDHAFSQLVEQGLIKFEGEQVDKTPDKSKNKPKPNK